MSNITDAQNSAVNNSLGITVTGGTTGSSSVQTVVSGTAFQISATRASHLYLDIQTSAALAIAIGPTSATAITVNASQSDALGFETLFVPAGWYVKLTGTVADFVATAVLI